jgi:hypothetical protein
VAGDAERICVADHPGDAAVNDVALTLMGCPDVKALAAASEDLSRS